MACSINADLRFPTMLKCMCIVLMNLSVMGFRTVVGSSGNASEVDVSSGSGEGSTGISSSAGSSCACSARSGGSRRVAPRYSSREM